MALSDNSTRLQEEEVNVKLVHSHSNFVSHPHELELYHCFAPMDKAKQLFEAYYKGELNLDSYHIVRKVPTRLAIDGVSLRRQMMLGGAFGLDLCDAIMLLYKTLDDRMYALGQTRWRHFLPASFAAKVLSRENYIEDEHVRASFIGKHITYNVPDCSMIIVPVLTNSHWSCYFWDFAAKKIHVLDPTMMSGRIANVEQWHASIVSILNNAISRCKDTFFEGWGVNMNSWTRCYRVGLGISCNKNNSGLLATQYSVVYDGSRLLYDMKTEDYGFDRADLLFQLLWSEGNYCTPEFLIDLMEV